MLQRIWAVTQKEFLQLLHNRLILPGLILAPALELVLFAYAIHTDVQHIPMAVADSSRSAASRAYLDAFTQSGVFDIAAAPADRAGVVQAIDSGQAGFGLVIPRDFADQLARGDATVLMLVDGSDSYVAGAASRSAAGISQQFAVKLLGVAAGPLQAHLDILYNPALKDLWFIVPGFGAFLIYGLALKLTAFAIVRERETGTIEALLVTPLRPFELMVGKMAPCLCIGMVNASTVLAVAVLGFGVPFRGSLLLFLALSVLFACGGLGLGLAISSISESQMQANQFASLVNIAAMFLSGFMFPAYSLPWLLRLLGYILPLTFFMPIVNGIFVKGLGLDQLWPPVLGLLALTAVIFYVGARAFRQRLD